MAEKGREDPRHVGRRDRGGDVRAALATPSLGSFVHFHVVVPDGVFSRDAEGAVTFHEGPAPSREDIAAVAATSTSA